MNIQSSIEKNRIKVANNAKTLHCISQVLNEKVDNITDIHLMKKGMTNRSFYFQCRGKKYIMRIPGEGTDKLINRKEEASVYHAIAGKDLSDRVLYINPENGYKITEFYQDARVCNAYNKLDVKCCLERLREFHEMKLQVEHEFDLFAQIEFYESLWQGTSSMYSDYAETKLKVFSLQNYIDEHKEAYCLTHIDAVPDNFLILNDGSIKLIDWEYAAMQDPHVDIAMFAIYSLYDKEQVDSLIDTYFNGFCPQETRIKIYCYIAVCGLLWSNWCEYKEKLGVKFCEYAYRQYQYAKNYFDIVQSYLIN